MSEVKLLKIELICLKDGMKVEVLATESFKNMVEITNTEKELAEAIEEIDTTIHKYLEKANNSMIKATNK